MISLSYSETEGESERVVDINYKRRAFKRKMEIVIEIDKKNCDFSVSVVKVRERHLHMA